MANCRHDNAIIKRLDLTDGYAGWIDCYCEECKQGWRGTTYSRVSRYGRLIKPPKWVQKIINELPNVPEDV